MGVYKAKSKVSGSLKIPCLGLDVKFIVLFYVIYTYNIYICRHLLFNFFTEDTHKQKHNFITRVKLKGTTRNQKDHCSHRK